MVAAGFSLTPTHKTPLKYSSLDFGTNPCTSPEFKGLTGSSVFSIVRSRNGVKGGNDSELGSWTNEEFKDYQEGVMEFWKDVLDKHYSGRWPERTNGLSYADGDFRELWTERYREFGDDAKSIYLPVPWNYLVNTPEDDVIVGAVVR